MLEYHSIKSLALAAEEKGRAISDIVIEDQAAAMEQSVEEIFAAMKRNLGVMRKSVETGMARNAKSRSGLSGGDAFRMKMYTEKPGGGPVSGEF